MSFRKPVGALFSLLVIWALTISTSQAGEYTMEEVLALQEAPTGVVFEVVSGNEDYLQTALADFEEHQKQLKTQFPDIKLAIVSHGSEQFALTTSNQQAQSATHSLVQRLTGDDSVPVHICAGHASWRDLKAEDFPDYVTVSKSGPGAVRDHQAQGYLLVML